AKAGTGLPLKILRLRENGMASATVCAGPRAARENIPNSSTRYKRIRMSLVVVGSVAYDAIETPYGKRERTLGGACTYIALSASYFSRVHIVAVVGEGFPDEDRELLASRNIGLDGLERAKGKTFFWSG